MSLPAAGLVLLLIFATVACSHDDATSGTTAEEQHSADEPAAPPGAARPPGSPPGPPPRTDQPRTVTPEMYGAVGDGAADDTAALQAAFDDVSPGDTVSLENGRTYRHSSVVVLGRPGTRLQGPGALLASEEARSALMVRADDVEIDGLVLRMTGTTRRWSQLDQHRLVLGAQTGTVVTDVRIEDSAAAGVYVQGARDFRLTDVEVHDTRADGIHVTGGASGGLVERPVVTGSGDDGVAVVSYDGDPETTRDVLITSPRVLGTTWGRGISVVGGEDVTYRDVVVERSSAAGIYIASEGQPYDTRPSRRVRVQGATVAGANHTAEVDHGALLVYAARGREVTDLHLSGVHISGTRDRASRQIGVLGDPGRVRSVLLEDFEVVGGGAPFFVSAGERAYRATGWSIDGERVPDRGAAL